MRIPVALRIAATLPRVGGHPLLDFVNTVDWRDREPLEYLKSYRAFLDWADAVGIVAKAEVSPLIAEAMDQPAAADRAFATAIALREASHGLLRAAALDQPGGVDDLKSFNHVLAAFPKPGELVAAGKGYAWSGAAVIPPLLRPVQHLAHSAAELLLSPDLDKVRLCAGPGCGWLFLDTSPNHRRRWCSMESCGNRAKARRHHARIVGS